MRKVWNYKRIKLPASKAFTIVELIVVIVVIGVLATLVFVGYVGLTSKADVASIQSDLTNNAKKLQLYYIRYKSFPTQFDSNKCPSAPTADTTLCLKLSGSNSINNYVGTASGYVLGIAKGSTCYQMTDTTNATNTCSSSSGYTAEQLLSQATWWIDAAYSTNGQTISNLGTGSSLNATNGSTTGVDANDAIFLNYSGTSYLYLPGNNNNYASVPDQTALDIAGDLDVSVRLAMDSWTPSAAGVLLSKYFATGNQRQYDFQIQSNGTLRLAWSPDGTSVTSVVSSVPVSASSGSSKWLRATLDVDNGSSGNDVKFWTSDDGSGWSQLGTTQTTAGITTIFNGTAPLQIGAAELGNAPIAAKIYRVSVKSGIGGTTVLDIDTSALGSGGLSSFTATSGQTVTINRSASGRKAVAVVAPVWLFGTDDYMEVADNDLLDFTNTDSFTIVGVVREWATPPLTGGVLLKKGSTTVGWGLRQVSTNFAFAGPLSDGTTTVTVSGGTFSAGQTTVGGIIVDGTAKTALVHTNGVLGATSSTSTLGSLSNTEAMRIGRFSGASTLYNDFEFAAGAVFRRTLTAGEITTLSNYFASRVK